MENRAGSMQALWPVYHPDIPPFLRELAETPEMRRLRNVGMNCGCEYTDFPRFRKLAPYFRFDHSVGVGLIVWHFTKSPAPAAAGLLHDIATPVFAHVVDFLNGDHLRQESTEARTAELIDRSPEIRRILQREGLTVSQVADYHDYPIADNDTPWLSADRLEYSLGNLWNYGLISFEKARSYYADLTVAENEDGQPELAFRTPETAAGFAMDALGTARIYVADEDRFSMEVLARLLRLALERNVIGPEDLYGTEPQVIRRLEADAVCGPLWRRYRGYTNIESRPSRPAEGQWLQIPAKLRCIDPLAVGMGRVSQWAPQFRQSLEEFRETSFDSWLGPV